MSSTLATTVARANGRFPQAQAILTVPGRDDQLVFLRSTFGVLVSHDGGKVWQWICERALGYEGTWDPPVAVTRDGRLWVGLERGLTSTVDGCEIATAKELDGEQIKDLTTDTKGETLWAVTGAPDKRGAVWRRAFATGAWERVGELPEGIHPMTIEVAPSRPSRVYVTGQPWGKIRGGLLRSDDGGKTWSGGSNDLAHEGPFFIAAIDTNDANRVILRHLHTTGSTVLSTTDGKTFKELLSMNSAMFGFTRTADGTTYYAGSGLVEDGIFRSTDRGEHFERMSNHGVLCLHMATTGLLFVCENPFALGGPSVGVSRDQAKTVTAIAKFTETRGPVACGDGGASVCSDAWPAQYAQFLPRPDAGARRARDGGALDASADTAPAQRRSSCGCFAAGASGGPDHRWLSAGFIPLIAWARARRRRGSSMLRRGRNHTG